MTTGALAGDGDKGMVTFKVDPDVRNFTVTEDHNSGGGGWIHSGTVINNVTGDADKIDPLDTVDFYNYRNATIKINKDFFDGVDTDDLEGVKFNLSKVTVPDPQPAQPGDMTTDSGGMATWTVKPGTYKLTEMPDLNGDGISDFKQGLMINSWAFKHPNGDPFGVTPSGTYGEMWTITVTSDQDPIATIVNTIKGSIHGNKFKDFAAIGNPNGQLDPGEGGLQDVKFTIQYFVRSTVLANTGSTVVEIWEDYTKPDQGSMTYSDKNGNFWFTGLEPGKRYRVYEAMPAGGYTEGEAKNIDLDNDGELDVHGYTMPSVLLAAQEYVAKAGDTIHVMDGVDESDPFPEPTMTRPDPGNDGLPPIAAENGSPWDVDANGELSPEEIAWATDSQALKDWYWTGLGGDYEVVVGGPLQFGNYKPRVDIKVTKWHDHEANGQGGNDTLLDGIDFTLSKGSESQTKTTGALAGDGDKGMVVFKVDPDVRDFTLTEDLNSGGGDWIHSSRVITNNTGDANKIDPGDTVDDYNYRNATIKVNKSFFDGLDTDLFDGIDFRLENGLSGNAKIDSTKTTGDDGSGMILWTIKPGAYSVTENPDINGDGISDFLQDLVIWSEEVKDAASSSGDGPVWMITVDSDQDAKLNVTNTILGSIHGFKYEDFNGNGVYDPGEFNDLNGNGNLDPGEGADPTDFQLEYFDGIYFEPSSEVPLERWVPQGEPETSDDKGYFWFTELDPGKRYRVVELESNFRDWEGGETANGGPWDGSADTLIWAMDDVLLAGQEFVPGPGVVFEV